MLPLPGASHRALAVMFDRAVPKYHYHNLSSTSEVTHTYKVGEEGNGDSMGQGVLG